jgi:pimeloyl-ACP methyl ester carboxylesterase
MPASNRVFLDVDGARLCCVDFGGSGPPILLVHGLAGRGNEWRDTADRIGL